MKNIRKNDRRIREAVREARARAGVPTDVEAFVEEQDGTLMINMRDTMTLPPHAKAEIKEAVLRILPSGARVSLT